MSDNNNGIPTITASRDSFTALIGSEGSVYIDPQLTIEEGTQELDGFFAFINNPVGDDDFAAYNSETDSLLLTTDDVNTIVGDDSDKLCVEFDTDTGVLKCVTADGVAHGYFDAATWQALARKVKFNTTADESVVKQTRITLGNKLALKTTDDRIVVPEVHAFASETTTVDDIIAEVEDLSHFGIAGHLATIRDEEVNQFVKDKIRNADGNFF